MRETGGEFAYDRLPHLTGHPTHLNKTSRTPKTQSMQANEWIRIRSRPY